MYNKKMLQRSNLKIVAISEVNFYEAIQISFNRGVSK